MSEPAAKYQSDLFDGRRKRRNPKRPAALEAREQEALFAWARLSVAKYPQLRLLHHIPNGGGRTPWEGRALKRRGVVPGVPDICLPVARGGVHGLYIELKRVGEGQSTSAAQEAFMEALRGQGYDARVCEGWEAAREAIEGYLSRCEVGELSGQ